MLWDCSPVASLNKFSTIRNAGKLAEPPKLRLQAAKRFRRSLNVVLEQPISRDPSTFSEGTWTLQTYITVSPITF